MKILAFDSTAFSASVALIDDNRLLGSFFTNNKLTHSRTLIPMAEALLENADVDIGEIGAFAVNAGPGSFTGVRIGVAAVKGLAFANNKPCISVSTLDSMAYNLRQADCTAVCVMDARCSQVYNSNYIIKDGTIKKLCGDRAVSVEQLGDELRGVQERIILAGDGAEICYNIFKDFIPGIIIADEHIRYQNAVSTAFLAAEKYNSGSCVAADELLPVYLRMPQAERELKKRKGRE